MAGTGLVSEEKEERISLDFQRVEEEISVGNSLDFSRSLSRMAKKGS